MVGPVEVTGAEPGDVLETRLEHLRTIDWGWNSFPLGVGALPADFKSPFLHYFRFDADRQATDFVDGIRLPLAPFLGVIAVEPNGDQPVSAVLSGPYGGNLVLRDLTVGSALFLPVQKPGARVWIGDVHALQGDGVVDQTAIETAAEEIRIRFRLHRGGAPIDGPVAETEAAWIVIAFADDLDTATAACVRRMIGWLADAGGLDRSDAYALCSMAVSFRVTQYAHQTGSVYTSAPPKAVHGILPKAILPQGIIDRLGTALRPTGTSV